MPGTTTLGQPWSRVFNTTIANYMKGATNNTLRKRTLLRMLQSKGRITYNWSGIKMVWRVEFDEAPIYGMADGDTSSFERIDRYKTAEIDWRGYYTTDAMYKGEYLQNRGPQAIVNIFKERFPKLMDNAANRFSEQLYADGTMPQNVKGIHGIETFMQSTQQVGIGAMNPSAVYAGIPCGLGVAAGGTWSQNGAVGWPQGRGDARYDFWSPLIIDVGDTYFSATNTWAANCVEGVGFAIINSKKSPAEDGTTDLYILNSSAYQTYIKQLRASQRIVIEPTIGDPVSHGFQDYVLQDGNHKVTWEYGLPTSADLSNTTGVIGYGINFDQMELRSQQDQIWVPDGPDWDIASSAWRWRLDFYGNIVWNPKYQTKFLNATNTADPAQM